MKIAIKRAVVVTATLLATALTLAACSSTPSGGTATSGTSAAKIGLLLPDSVTARYASADKPLFEAKIKALCPTCTVLYANADGDAAKQQQQAESMLTQGVKVLVLDPFDGAAAQSIVAEAAAKKVPVISYDRLIAGGKANLYISFDNEKVGQLQATALVDKLKADGVPAGSGILMINGSPTDNNATLFKKGAHSVIDTSGYKVLAEFDTPGWTPANAQTWMDGQITKFGAAAIKGIYAANDGVGGAAIASLQAAGVTKMPPITGQDASLAGIQNILAGTQYMTIYKAFKPEAEAAAQAAIDLINGKTPTSTSTVSGVPSILLTPLPVTVDKIESTVVADKLYTVADICTTAYAAACTAAGVK
ncbi:MAG: ABC transporter substrate-binding protein [Lacisediminihabitans sp.]